MTDPADGRQRIPALSRFEEEAKVTRAYKSVKTPTGPRGKPPGTSNDAIAWIVCFEILTGTGRGVFGYTFQHPDDRIAMS